VREIGAARSLRAVTMLVASAGLVFATPADAGCETQATRQYCDLPPRPDGTWDRCRIIFGQGVRGIGSHRNTEMRCYPINPAKSFPFAYNEPQHYIP
jgi:hypothetical protein